VVFGENVIVIFIYILGIIGWLKGCMFMYGNFVVECFSVFMMLFELFEGDVLMLLFLLLVYVFGWMI